MVQTVGSMRTVIITGQSDAKGSIYSILADVESVPVSSRFTRKTLDATRSVGLVGDISEPQDRFGLASAWHEEDKKQKTMPVVIAGDFAGIPDDELNKRIAYAKQCVPVGSQADVCLVSTAPIKNKNKWNVFCQTAGVCSLGHVDVTVPAQVQKFRQCIFAAELPKNQSSLLSYEKPAQRAFSFKGLFFSGRSKKQGARRPNPVVLDSPLHDDGVTTKSKERVAAGILLSLAVVVPPLSLVGLGLMWHRKRKVSRKNAPPPEPGTVQTWSPQV